MSVDVEKQRDHQDRSLTMWTTRFLDCIIQPFWDGLTLWTTSGVGDGQLMAEPSFKQEKRKDDTGSIPGQVNGAPGISNSPFAGPSPFLIHMAL